LRPWREFARLPAAGVGVKLAAMNLSNIRIVLVETTHPGNIGAAARAMKTMGLRRLELVRPAQFPHADASARASGADDLLAAARVCGSLEEALAGCRFVVGTTARGRRLAWPQLDPRTCAARLASESERHPAALVFGRERTGLTNRELEHCHAVVHIPTDPGYSSLNLAAAVQVLAYELRMHGLQPAGEPAAVRSVEDLPADAEAMARFYAHLEEVLVQVEFLDPEQPKQLMRRLKRLFARARPDVREINILRGILTAVQRRLGQ